MGVRADTYFRDSTATTTLGRDATSEALSIGSKKSIIPYDFLGTEPKKGYDIAVESHFFVHQMMS